MRGRIFPAVVSLFLFLVLAETQAWAIFDCYDYVFWKLTGFDATPPNFASRDPRVKEYGPACQYDRSKGGVNNIACIEAVLNKIGDYVPIATDTYKTPVPRLGPQDVVYINGNHIAYSHGFNYHRDANLYETDPNREIEGTDEYPVLSHWLEIPQTYYNDPSMDTIEASIRQLNRYHYGFMGGTRKGTMGGFSKLDTFWQVLVKDHVEDASYVVYKKKRLDVIIEVRDGKNPVEGASIDLDGYTYKTGKKGRILVELEPVDKYRDKDLPFVIRKAGFKEEKRALYAFQMKPSAEFIVYPADLEKADLTQLMNRLNFELAEKLSRLDSACLALVTLDEERGKTIGKTPNVPKEYWLNRGVLYQNLSKECSTLKAKRLQFTSIMTSAEGKAGPLRSQMDRATAMKCENKADLAGLESLDTRMNQTARDIYKSQQNALAVHNAVTKTLWSVDNEYNRFYSLPFLSFLSGEMPMPEDRLQWLKTFRDKRFTKAYQETEKARSDCVEAYRTAAKTVSDTAAAQGLVTRSPAGVVSYSDSRVAEFVRSASNMSPRPGQPCDENRLKKDLDEAVGAYVDICTYTTPQGNFIAALKARCNTSQEDIDFIARYNKISEELNYYNEQRAKLLKIIADCRTAVSKAPPAKKGPVKPSPPPMRTELRIDGPAEAFVGDRMDFKAVILNKQFASDILRPEGAYAMYWYVDGKRRGDMQYYSDTVNFHAATVGTHTLRVDFVWGSPKTGKVTLLGSKTIQVVIKKKESQDYANVSVPHGKWVPTGLSVKKGDVIEIEAKDAYTTKDGGKIGPEGGGTWRFWTLAVRYGKTVHLPGRGNTYYAEESGDVELGTPRGAGSDKFLPEDIANLQGALSVRVTVKRKTP